MPTKPRLKIHNPIHPWVNEGINPWIGCSPVSDACRHCRAQGAKGATTRRGKQLDTLLWGDGTPRDTGGFEAALIAIQRAQDRVRTTGTPWRVLCAETCDVLEDRRDLDPYRDRLWAAMEAAPEVEFFVLTKRPENIDRLTPWTSNWPSNIWVGVSAESQYLVELRMAQLVGSRCPLRFLVVEPMTDGITIARWTDKLDWVICGGDVRRRPESRRMRVSWVADLMKECRAAKIQAFFTRWDGPPPRSLDQIDNRPVVFVTVADGIAPIPLVANSIWVGKPCLGRQVMKKRKQVQQRPSFWDRLHAGDESRERPGGPEAVDDGTELFSARTEEVSRTDEVQPGATPVVERLRDGGATVSGEPPLPEAQRPP